jgi:dihydropteroate synthase
MNKSIDDQLSQRALDLDPAGYFIIYIDRERQLIHADHYTNTINAQGLATDPETGEVIPARGGSKRTPTAQFVGRSAKEVCIRIFEETDPPPVSQLSHSAYLGRELQKAEWALYHNGEYIQD